MIQVSAKVAVAQTFDKHNDLAVSIVYLGANVGGIVILQLHAVWIPEYGVPGCILLTGAFLFHACAAGTFLSLMKCTRLSNDSQENVCKNAANWTNKYRELLRSPLFLIWLLIIIIDMGTSVTILTTFVDHVTSLGYSETTGAFLLSLIDFIGIPFRILYGWISDKSEIYKFHMALASFAVTGLMSVLFGLISTENGLYTLLVIFACAKSSVVTSTSIITKHLSEESNRAQAFGLVSTTKGISIAAAGPFMGKYNYII